MLASVDRGLIFGITPSDACHHNSNKDNETTLLFEMNNNNSIGSSGGGGFSKKHLHSYNNKICDIKEKCDENNNDNKNAIFVLRSLVDNFIIEFVASLFVYISLGLFWNAGDELRFAPAATLGLVMLCLKDEDLFFPDASPTVTFLLYVLGGYHWSHLVARVLGQGCALGISIWFCSTAVLPVLDFRVKQPLNAVFGLEVLGSALEHLTVVYFVLPMLPTFHDNNNNTTSFSTHNNKNTIKKKKAMISFFHQARFGKRKCDSIVPPPAHLVLHAALIITVLHYLLQRGFCVEVNPFSSIFLASVMMMQQRTDYEHGNSDGWDHAGAAIWGQLLGVLFVAAYSIAFAPRLPRYK